MLTYMKEFFEKVKSDALEKNNTKGYHKVVKSFSSKEKPKPFDVRTLMPGKSDAERCEEVAEYFIRVSDEFVPLLAPVRCSEERVPPELHKIASRLRHMKKPRSQVRGDIPPELATEYADILAIPLGYIFGQVYKDLSWPEMWKQETVTVIPKNSAPASLAEMRNLSCTPLFSKLLESFILDDIKEQTSLSCDQYGGLKGSGPDHFLAVTWHEILASLDAEDGAASTLTSIDFAKAFNRMCHHAYLEALATHGTSPATLSLVSAFLCERKMSVRIGDELS